MKIDIVQWRCFLIYVPVACLSVFVVTGSWIFLLAFLIISLGISYFAGKKEGDLESSLKLRKSAVSFMESLFDSLSSGLSPEKAYSFAYPSLTDAMRNRKFEEVKANPNLLDSLPFQDFSLAVKKTLSVGKMSIDSSSRKILADYKSENSKLESALKSEEEAMLSSLFYLLVFVAIKVFYGKNLIDYSDVLFCLLYSLLALCPLVVVFLSMYLRSEKK